MGIEKYQKEQRIRRPVDYAEFFKHGAISGRQCAGPCDPFLSPRGENGAVPVAQIGHERIPIADVGNGIFYAWHRYNDTRNKIGPKMPHCESSNAGYNRENED